jgi:hypothetical protein
VSVHYVTLNALDVIVGLVGPGTEVGEDTVPEGKLGVVLRTASDTVVVIGTAQQLRERVYDGLSAPIPADVPLTDGDEPTYGMHH